MRWDNTEYSQRWLELDYLYCIQDTSHERVTTITCTRERPHQPIHSPTTSSRSSSPWTATIAYTLAPQQKQDTKQEKQDKVIHHARTKLLDPYPIQIQETRIFSQSISRIFSYFCPVVIFLSTVSIWILILITIWFGCVHCFGLALMSFDCSFDSIPFLIILSRLQLGLFSGFYRSLNPKAIICSLLRLRFKWAPAQSASIGRFETIIESFFIELRVFLHWIFTLNPFHFSPFNPKAILWSTLLLLRLSLKWASAQSASNARFRTLVEAFFIEILTSQSFSLNSTPTHSSTISINANEHFIRWGSNQAET
jgi:hypothetical protein